MELELQDSNGFPMSPTDYLKQSLQRADAVAFGLCSVNTTGCSVKSIPRLLWYERVASSCVTEGGSPRVAWVSEGDGMAGRSTEGGGTGVAECIWSA
jgi:hypothetical protein